MATISKQEMCAKCLRRDHLSQSGYVMCHICDKIYHYSCTEIGYRDISNNEIFYCDACLNSSNALSTNIQVFKEGFRETLSSKIPNLEKCHTQYILIFLNIIVVYISRLNIGIALVAMTTVPKINPNFPTYDWHEKEISYILSSFYFGYIITQVLGRVLSRRFGIQKILSLSTFGTALLSVITPWSVRWGGWQVFCMIRAGQGLFQGTMLPCIYEHSRKSFTLKAQYKLAAWILSAMNCGTFFALAISGLIAESPIGWPGISYFSGGLCFGCCILWWIFSAANNVVESISTAEMDAPYGDSSLTHRDEIHSTNFAVSWKTILLSMSLYALLVVRLSEAWGVSILQEQMPLYMNGVLNLNIKLNGIFSALPFLLMLGLSYIFDFLAKDLQRKTLSSWSIPITLSIIGSWMPAIGLIAIGFLDKSHKTWILLITTICGGVYSSATIVSSWNANHVEIIHTISNFMPLISPLVMKAIVTDLSSRIQWQIVFAAAAVILLVGNIFYIISGITKSHKKHAKVFIQLKDIENETGLNVQQQNTESQF